MPTESTSDFWNWFAARSREIQAAYRNEDHEWLDREIGPRVRRIEGRLNWELGPYHAPEDTFVLSPTVRQNLDLTRTVIAAAPKLAGWHFLPAKPPKKLKSLQFSARERTIDAKQWRYQLIAYNQGEFVDIRLFVPAANFPANDENLFCELVVESLIGEACRLDRVGYLLPEVVDNDTQLDEFTPIEHLGDHLLSILKALDT